MPTKADLEVALADKEREFEEFKETVKRVAKDYGERHSWCEVVDQALVEMGLGDELEITLHITVELSGTLKQGRMTSDTDLCDFVRDSLKFEGETWDDLKVTLDGDWESDGEDNSKIEVEVRDGS